MEYIIDIGCGTGNLTTLLAGLHKNVKFIYGIDMDEQMIEFAKNNNNRDNIEYLIQDISLDWYELRPELKELEGKVSLIFSNYCLHWIFNKKDNVSKNMYRLLAHNGKVYTTIYCLDNLADRMINPIGSYLLDIINRILPVPSQQVQEQEWSHTFESTGFETIEFVLKESRFSYTKDDAEKFFLLVGFQSYQQFFGRFIMMAAKGFLNFTGYKLSSNLPHYTDEITGAQMVQNNYKYFIYILAK